MKRIKAFVALLCVVGVVNAQSYYWGQDGAWKASPLSATTTAIGGSALTLGNCATGTVTVTGATTAMMAATSPTANPGSGMHWFAFVSAANTVTVKVCAAVAGTPVSTTYVVKVFP